MSFFDDEDELQPTTIRRPRPPRPPARGSRAARALAGRRAGSPPPGHRDLVVRRRVLAGVAAVVVILVVLLIAGLLHSGDSEALEHYNQSVSRIATESDEKVSAPFFQALAGARSGQRSVTETQVDEARATAEGEAAEAGRLSVPGGLGAAQGDLLQVLDLRAEGLRKVGEHLSVALGGQSESAAAYKYIGGAMEILLASDVIYAQRVAPLVQQALAEKGISGQSTAGSRFLPNLGWLEPATVAARTGGHLGSTKGAGTVDSALLGVSVGSNSLAPAPEMNHIKSGANPTFTIKVENVGSAPESGVTADVVVTAQGKQYSAFGTIETLAPGQSATVNVPVEGVPLGGGAKIAVEVQALPGETNLENNKAAYEAIFS